MAARKGENLEELVRAFFSRQGYFCLRGVTFSFEGESATDIDVWLYGKQGASIRTRAVVDVKNKKSPKAFERILWVRGMQLAIGCDRALVATTETDPRIARFARDQKVALISRAFLSRIDGSDESLQRLSKEEFYAEIKRYPAAKQDGDWIKIVEGVRSSLISTHGFAAFNHAMKAFSFFANRIDVRAQSAEQAARCAYLVAAVGCIALDSALSGLFYDDVASRRRSILNGVAYGDAGDGKVQNNIDMVLAVIRDRVDGGRVISAQVSDAFAGIFSGMRSEIIAEFFSRDFGGINLFRVGKELEERAHSRDFAAMLDISLDAKAAVGVFADFVDVPRAGLITASMQVDRAADNLGEVDGSLDVSTHQTKLL